MKQKSRSAAASSSDFPCPKDGEIIEFKGCAWIEDQWEFGNPGVIYAPVCTYSDDLGSNSEESIEQLVENICIDLVVDGSVRRGWSAGELHDFKWRGWSPKGFARRKRATHATIKVRFYKDPKRPDEMCFEILPPSPPKPKPADLA